MNRVKEFIKSHIFLKRVVLACYGIIMFLCKWAFILFIPIKKNKIVICSYYGKGYGDNSKYIVEEIIKQNLNYDIVWLVNNNIDTSTFPSIVRAVKYGSIRGIYELATAKVWIDNSRKFFYPPKREKQFYIQTWHGSLGLKKCEKDAEHSLSEQYLELAKKDSTMADLFLANGKFITNLYRNSFWYTGEILQSGSPRNDILITQDVKIREKVLKELNIKENKKILLYAPTFRNSNNTEIYNINYETCMESLKNKFGGDWITLVRLHPNMFNEHLQLDCTNVYNVTKYPDMQELLLISDILITDYSSCMFDFGLKRTPCFLFVPDEMEYMNERNFYFNLDELPFKKANTNHELTTCIENFDVNIYIKKIDIFLEQQGILEDGKASQNVVEYIKKNII